jgi:murein L,D-transpeptidase YcbB/YkuD
MTLRSMGVPALAGCLLVLVSLATGCTRREGRSLTPEIQKELRARLEAPRPPAFVDKGEAGSQLWSQVRRFYARHEEEPVWLAGERSRRQATELVHVLAEAPLEGLDAADYDPGPAAAVVEGSASPRSPRDGKPDAAAAAEAELRLSYSFMKYARHLTVGRLTPRDLDPSWVGDIKPIDLADLLDEAMSRAGVRAALEARKPHHPQYGLLKQSLQRYRDIAARGGWPTNLREERRLRKGERSPQVPLLRTRLRASGDIVEPTLLARLKRLVQPADLYDEGLAQSVARFEERHGLDPHGELDAKTVAALNVPVAERILEIELNLERWRWLPRELGPRYVMVNTPAFQLEAFEGGRRALQMRIAAGTKDHPTPIFSDEMTEVVFSPYWNIPPRIAREEWIPEVVRDPDYLRENGLEIVKGDRVLDPREVNWKDEDLRLRQRPGAGNLLGLVTFKFPNRFNVYIHDTPFDSAFHRAARDLSHGCVRIEKPEELAEWVLKGQDAWTRRRIEEAMHAGVEQTVKIERPIPVYLVYQTVWVAPDGSALFSDDLYGHDATQLARLAGKSSDRVSSAAARTEAIGTP